MDRYAEYGGIVPSSDRELAKNNRLSCLMDLHSQWKNKQEKKMAKAKPRKCEMCGKNKILRTSFGRQICQSCGMVVSLCQAQPETVLRVLKEEGKVPLTAEVPADYTKVLQERDALKAYVQELPVLVDLENSAAGYERLPQVILGLEMANDTHRLQVARLEGTIKGIKNAHEKNSANFGQAIGRYKERLAELQKKLDEEKAHLARQKDATKDSNKHEDALFGEYKVACERIGQLEKQVADLEAANIALEMDSLPMCQEVQEVPGITVRIEVIDKLADLSWWLKGFLAAGREDGPGQQHVELLEGLMTTAKVEA